MSTISCVAPAGCDTPLITHLSHISHGPGTLDGYGLALPYLHFIPSTYHGIYHNHRFALPLPTPYGTIITSVMQRSPEPAPKADTRVDVVPVHTRAITETKDAEVELEPYN